MKHHFINIPENRSHEREKYIELHWEKLHKLSKDSGDLAIQYLFTSNAGGAGIILAYLGKVGNTVSTKELTGAKLTLLFFTLGIIFVGFYRANIVHYYEKMFYNFHEAVGRYYIDGNWNNLKIIEEQNIGKHSLPYILGYASMITFILGCIVGGITIIA